jgi:hypothetical protein
MALSIAERPLNYAFQTAINYFSICHLIIVISLALPLSLPKQGHAQTAPQIKAAFVYNFAKFVEWPPNTFPEADSPIIIGILQGEPMSPALEDLAEKVVQGRKLIIKRSPRIDDLKKSQIFFTSIADSVQLRRNLATFRGLPVLTVTDEVKNFLSTGSVINFVTLEDKIRFEINGEIAQQSGLHISSHLLKLAVPK